MYRESLFGICIVTWANRIFDDPKAGIYYYHYFA